ncbi:hypothetical protein ACFYMW_31410 [Streptomyces sp. NPDC006692]|uniref:hypothetical protein n=1 Tax=Streptomyces sp. NPDC006692 TaxID=3364758 RepID=UPI00368CF437
MDEFFGHDRRPDLLSEVVGREAAVDDQVALVADGLDVPVMDVVGDSPPARWRFGFQSRGVH